MAALIAPRPFMVERGHDDGVSVLKMVQGEKIFGRLVDEKQRPIAGAQLRSVSIPKSGSDRVRTTSVDNVSGKDGQFEKGSL